ncbi:MerR family transcriptional regulator [Gulosibacter macacae]|uniref:MerR family transcriptional regulator n=1 Tax=Gulosibacter macacae TaxID=2488791 RepID=A0A3P3VUX4_9MICO|nr:MerR family transcriptional regulator [Gulosibacter macacae]
MVASHTARKTGAVPKLSIGQVLQRLGSDFPELAPSKLRFLEEQGLLHPARTPSGYRKFSDADVERIRTILELQRDHYFPLKKIGEYLDAIDRGERPERPGAAAVVVSVAPSAAPSMLPNGVDLSRDELIRRAGATKELLEQAHVAGLLPRAKRYVEDDLVLLTSLVELERRGIGPRHLRPFRTAAQHELGLIEQATAAGSRRGDAAARARAEAQGREIADQLERVRRALVRQGMRERSS